MNRQRNLIIDIAGNPRMLQRLTYRISLLVILLAQPLHKILRQPMSYLRELIPLQAALEIICAHTCPIEWVAASVEEHIAYDCTSPDINSLRVRGAAENLRRHIQQGTTLRPHVGVLVLLHLGREAEICDLDGGEVVGVSEENVFQLILEILAWLDIAMNDVQSVKVPQPLEEPTQQLSHLPLPEGFPTCPALLHQLSESAACNQLHLDHKAGLGFEEGVKANHIAMLDS